MEPFPERPGSDDGARRAQQSIMQALRGRAPLEKFAAKDPREALTQLAGLPVKDLELTAFAGEAGGTSRPSRPATRGSSR